MLNSSNQPPDQLLVSQANQGDLAALDALIERHFQGVYAIALARLRNTEAAEDLAQEVFLRVQLHLGQFDASGSFGAWIGRITRNLTVDWIRRGQRASRLLPMVPLESVAEVVPSRDAQGARETVNAQLESESLRKAIFTLPKEEREVVLLHLSEELTDSEIGDRLGVHRSTVSRRLKSATQRLQSQLSPASRQAASLRAPRFAVERTLLVAASVSALAPAAKANLASAATLSAGATHSVSLASLFHSASDLITGALKPMATAKGIALVSIVAALSTGALVWNAPVVNSTANAATTSPAARADADFIASITPNQLVALLPDGQHVNLAETLVRTVTPTPSQSPNGQGFHTFEGSSNVIGLPRQFEIAIGIPNLTPDRIHAVNNAQREMVFLTIAGPENANVPPFPGTPVAVQVRAAENNPNVSIISFDQPLPDGMMMISVQETNRTQMAQISETGAVDQEYMRNRGARISSSGANRQLPE